MLLRVLVIPDGWEKPDDTWSVEDFTIWVEDLVFAPMMGSATKTGRRKLGRKGNNHTLGRRWSVEAQEIAAAAAAAGKAVEPAKKRQSARPARSVGRSIDRCLPLHACPWDMTLPWPCLPL